jgi:hypothetical protein
MSCSRLRLAMFLSFSLLTPVLAATDWGYGNDSLQADLARWRAHPEVRIDSIGASVQGRPLWMVSITDSSDSLGSVQGRLGRKRRVVVHARTHPSEVQATWVAREMIRVLLESGETSRLLRRDFVFHILPQYNPDGVALGNERTNANGVDLESNWDKAFPEPEVAALRGLFRQFMAGPIPVEVALNLHSDQYNGKRFFFYHEEGGTSWIYTELEKNFIAGVQSHFQGGIEDWNFITSWANATGVRYPEGYWWTNHRESVMALTYEDNNRVGATGFDTTGRALVLGVGEYLRTHPLSVTPGSNRRTGLAATRHGVQIAPSAGAGSWEVLDLQGRRLGGGAMAAAGGLLPWSELFPGSVRILVFSAPGRGPAVLLLPALVR